MKFRQTDLIVYIKLVKRLVKWLEKNLGSWCGATSTVTSSWKKVTYLLANVFSPENPGLTDLFGGPRYHRGWGPQTPKFFWEVQEVPICHPQKIKWLVQLFHGFFWATCNWPNGYSIKLHSGRSAIGGWVKNWRTEIRTSKKIFF